MAQKGIPIVIKLTPKQNHLAYAGAFASPAMALWGAPPATLEGMLGAFAEFGAQIDGIGDRARVEFQLGGLSADISNFVDDEVPVFAEVLAAAYGWLKSGVLTSGPQFTSHVVTASGHYEMEGTTASEFLMERSDLALESFGTNRGSGIVYHGDLEKRRMELSLDHSVIHGGALFLRFVMLSLEDAVEHDVLFAEGEALVMASLKELELEFGDAG